MNSKRGRIGLIVVLVLFSLACTALSGTPTSTPVPTAAPTETPLPTDTPLPTATPEPTAIPESTATPEPTATPKPAQPAEPIDVPEVEGASIEVINASGRDIWYIYISPSDADDWGEDKLDDDVILDGEPYVFTGIPEGVYDLQAQDPEGNVIEVLWEVTLTDENTWTVSGMASLEIINESSEIIASVYIAPSDESTWGEDWLGGTAIKSGGSYVVTGLENGIYDAKATNADGDLIESIYSVDLEGEHNWTVYGKIDLPDNAVLRFEEDFTDNRNNWGQSGESDDVNYMQPADGEYCILIKADNLTAWEWYEPFRTDEFVAEVSCRLDPVADASCGLGFGPDGDNLYWFEVSPSDQTFALFVLQDDVWQDPLIEWTVSKNIVPEGVNFLSLERVQDVVSVFINGILAGQVDSTLFPTGRVGLGGSTYDTGYVTACLDDLSVWRLE